ncbi:hypothetical protein [Nitrogeniibacter aestuarii]|uniref:hypothetical protein n=1 Tax=Nitrogeniibacter aestuarii TaxID=2815343 RepID=UPI001D10180A|nr:hypothetical protein [Nitrogeniibacter aestuarii]
MMQVRDLFDDLPLPEAGADADTINALLNAPLDLRHGWVRTERLIDDARHAMPARLELNVAMYKLLAYSGRLEAAEALIDETLERAAAAGGFDADPTRLLADDARWQAAQGHNRLYLYSLKAMGFVRLRRGNLDGATSVLDELARLDPLDQVGGSVVADLAERLQMADAA